MANNPSGNDPRKIWQSQEREISTMTLEKLIRRRAQELHRKTRWERLSTLVAPVGVLAFSALGISMGYYPVQRAVLAIAFAWSVAGAYALNRGTWPVALAADAAMATGLEFCRREIERRIYVYRRLLLWAFAPIVLAVGAFVVPGIRLALKESGTFANMAPFLTLFALWLVGVFVVRSWKWRTLRREIDELNDIEKENR